MQKDNINKYLKQLEDLELRIDDAADPDELMKEVNKVIGEISKDVQVELKEHALTATLKFINTSDNPDPDFAKEGDSGFDLRANLPVKKDIVVPGNGWRLIPTGLFFEVQKGLEIQIRSRSGLAAKTGLFVLNSPGTLDSSYRGEIKIILMNVDEDPKTIRHGDRIAQGVVCPVYGEGNLKMLKVDELTNTERNSGGFGSTGIS